MKRTLLVLSFGLLLSLIAAPAFAGSIAPSYWSGLIESDHSSTGLGTAPFGLVELSQVGNDVKFKVTLYDNSLFVRTGALNKYNFAFNGTNVSLSDISATGITKGVPTLGASLGTFGFAVYFTGQGTGGGNGLPGPLEFTVVNAAIADLIVANSKGNIFLIDIISGQNSLTGVVDVNREKVPEPSLLTLLGIGLVCATGFRRFTK
jgi:hypothetical protein